MIPILYRPDEIDFLSNGIGRLSECSECVVTEERNGIYELEFKYPITGRFYQTMVEEGGTVAVIHDDKHDIQPFDIYSYTAPIDGIVTFNAHHISYRLSRIIVEPFSASSCATAFQGLKDHSVNKNVFTFWTNKATQGQFTLLHPDNIRALLGGQAGSLLDVYGKGEYEFDKYQVRLYLDRGVDSGVTIRYGKNLTDIERNYSEESTFNAVAPYYTGTDGTITLPEQIVISPNAPLKTSPWTADNGDYITDENGERIYFQYIDIQPQPLDLSGEFQEPPTVEQLRQKALDYLATYQPWTPRDNIEIDFVQLWQTPEYESVSSLQRLSLCDTVSIYYPELGVTATNAKIIRVVYNVLLERYDSMEVGTPKTSFADYLKGDIAAAIREDPEFSGWQAAINHATELITGGLGGHVVMTPNANGEPQEILIMDTDDINTAVHVIRINKNGIGFSDNGYAGPYESAWTIDGQFNADFITTGSILANYIKGGTLSLGGKDNTYGQLVVFDSNSQPIVTAGSFGIDIKKGLITLRSDDWQNGTTATLSNGALMLTRYSSGVSQETVYMSATNVTIGDVTYYGVNIPEVTQITKRVIQHRLEFDDVEGHNIEWKLNADPQYPDNVGLHIREHNPSVEDVNLRSTRVELEGVWTAGYLKAYGTKTRIVRTSEYGDRQLYCYETPSPLFGDIGEGVIDEAGLCYVFLDPVFAETIAANQYQVFLQNYGEGICHISERKPGYFVVTGEPGLAFGWEIKAKQSDFDQLRLEREQDDAIEKSPNYGTLGNEYYINLQEGRIAE